MKFLHVFIPLAVGSTAFSADSQFAIELGRLQQDQHHAVQAALEPVNRRYADALQALLRRATSSGDLDTAVKIKAELEKVAESTKAGTGDTALGRFVGTWNLSYTNGATRVYEIEADGTVRYLQDSGREISDKTGKIALQGKDFIIDFGETYIERVSRIGDTLNLEHFAPRGSYPKDKPLFRASGKKNKD